MRSRETVRAQWPICLVTGCSQWRGFFWIALNEGELEIRSWMLALYGLAGHLAQKETPLAGWRAGFEKFKG